MNSRALLQQTLDALTEYMPHREVDRKIVGDVVDAIRAHLEKKPVAWLGEGGTYVTLSDMSDVGDYEPLFRKEDV